MVVLVASSPAPARSFPQAAALDAGFAKHPVLTMTHIIPELLFMVLVACGSIQENTALKPR
jgi:hypothetical protein